jgi:hypothetical protein
MAEYKNPLSLPWGEDINKKSICPIQPINYINIVATGCQEKSKTDSGQI